MGLARGSSDAHVKEPSIMQPDAIQSGSGVTSILRCHVGSG